MTGTLKILPLLFALGVLFIQCEKDEPYVKIRDDNFLNALIESGVDTDGDGLISKEEAAAVTYLDVSEESISDLTGIEAFINLDNLICGNNYLTHLDISNNTGLLVLLCYGNLLNDLNVSHNTALTVLQCFENPLTSLDVSNNTDLYVLHCFNSQLSSLDVSNNTNLIHFWCYGNQLASLDVSNNPLLKNLFCNNNQLSSLDVSNNMQLRNLKLGEMPSLNKVCVWTLPFPTEEVYVNTLGSPNVYFTTECSK